MQQCTVRVAESMPIDSLQTSSLARGSECLFSEIVRRERKASVVSKYQMPLESVAPLATISASVLDSTGKLMTGLSSKQKRQPFCRLSVFCAVVCM